MKSSPDIAIAARSPPPIAVAEPSLAYATMLDPLAVPGWDEMIAPLFGATFFHTAAWARVLQGSYGYKPPYFAKVADGKIRALLPTMEVDSWLTGRRGISLPFSDSCELLASDPRDASELLTAAIAHGRARNWKYLEFRGLPSSVLTSQDSALRTTHSALISPSSSFFSHTLDVSRDEEKIFASFDSVVRRNIRKAEKSGLTIEVSRTFEDLQAFYYLHCLTRQKHGVPPQPFHFFAQFHRHVISHNHGFVVIARLAGRPVSASVFVHFGTKALYKYGASDESCQHLRGANLVMWRAIQWFSRAGYEELHFGRTEKTNPGLRRYKLGWSPREDSLDYFKLDLPAHAFVPDQGEPGGLRKRIVQHIPILIARWIGRALYRHVA